MLDASTTQSPVLIVSTKVDLATDAVVRELNRRGEAFLRFNTEEFPFDSNIGVEFRVGSVKTSFAHGSRRTEGPFRSLWYRRVRMPQRPAIMTPPVFDFCLQEARATLLGAVQSETCPKMSDPSAVWRAENKVVQLCVAQEVGLPIPDTLVTNEPEKIRSAFFEFDGQMICKPIRTGYVAEGTGVAIFTSRVLVEHLEQLGAAQLSPSIYQRLVNKKSDVRVTFVGERYFAAEIQSQEDPAAQVDWRHTTDPRLPHTPIDLPDDLVLRLGRLMELLGLSFGAIDLVRTLSGDFIFLEVNPNGQWLWIEELLGHPITDSIADWLLQPRSM